MSVVEKVWNGRATNPTFSSVSLICKYITPINQIKRTGIPRFVPESIQRSQLLPCGLEGRIRVHGDDRGHRAIYWALR